MNLSDIVDLDSYPITDPGFREECKKEFDKDGVFIMPGFVLPSAIDSIRDEGEANPSHVHPALARRERSEHKAQ